MTFKILAINPGSTSTKVALFANENLLFEEKISHPSDQLQQYQKLWDQFELRKKGVENFLEKHAILKNELSAVVGRGGLIKSIPGGTYLINDSMIDDARIGLQGVHAANLGCAIAKNIADDAGIPAYVVDPISVDEFEPLARYSGLPQIQRRALAHTLNIHTVGRMAAENLSVSYEQVNFVVAHLGGGISVCALKKGKIVDVNDASSSGPFAPDRSGELPLQPFIELCFSGKYSEAEMKKLVMGKGGLIAYLNTNDAVAIEQRIEQGDTFTKEVYQAMAYQIAKDIGAYATVLTGEVEAIVISGGLAKSHILVDWIRNRVKFIANVLVFPGEFEMEALAKGALRILTGEEIAKVYE